MPDHDAPRPGGWRSGDALNAFTTEQRQLFRRIAATDVTHSSSTARSLTWTDALCGSG